MGAIKNLFIIILIFSNDVSAREVDSYFLSCSGAHYLEDPENFGNLIKSKDGINTYEIKNKNLYIPMAHRGGVLIEPTNYGDHEILYFVESHPQFSFMKKYHLSLNRITGFVKETHTQFKTTLVFQGKCTLSFGKEF